jgi:large repetitive protein
MLQETHNTASSSATSISYDTLAPTVSLVRTGSGTLKSGQTDTITFTLSEAATDFAVGDITVSGGTLSSFTATSSTVYTVIFTPTADTASGSGSVSVAGATFTDAAGNSNTASSATSISYDTLVPTVSLTRTGSGTLKSGQTDTITFTLSEAATDFAVGDVTVSGGTLSSFTATSSTAYTVIFTPTADTASGSGSVSVAGATFTDAAGNNNTASSATSISYDTLVPTVSLTRTGSGTLKSGQTDTITFTLSEAATDFRCWRRHSVWWNTLLVHSYVINGLHRHLHTNSRHRLRGWINLGCWCNIHRCCRKLEHRQFSATTISYDTLAPTVSLSRTGSGTLQSR